MPCSEKLPGLLQAGLSSPHTPPPASLPLPAWLSTTGAPQSGSHTWSRLAWHWLRMGEGMPPGGHGTNPREETEDQHIQELTFRKILVFPTFHSLSVPSRISAMRRVIWRALSRNCQGENRSGSVELEQHSPPPKVEAEGPFSKAFWDSSLPPPLGFTISVTPLGHRLRHFQIRMGSRGAPGTWDLKATALHRPGALVWLSGTWTAQGLGWLMFEEGWEGPPAPKSNPATHHLPSMLPWRYEL